MLKDYKNYPYKTKILFYAAGTHHFEMYKNIIDANPDIMFAFTGKNFLVEDFLHSHLANKENTAFSIDKDHILSKIDSFDFHISTEAQTTHPHIEGVDIVNEFKAKGKKTFEIQHGLFQLGMHYADLPSATSSVHNIIAADSLPAYSNADELLLFYPIDIYEKEHIIGYPNYIKDEDSKEGEYTLILTNLHWSAYSSLESLTFYISILSLARDNPDKLFIWKMHRGEADSIKKINSIISSSGFSNLKNLQISIETPILNLLTTTELIKNAKNVISSISTVLMECEQYKKPTIIYKAKGIKALSDKIPNADFFSDYDELKLKFANDFKKLETNLLLKYNNDAFRKALGLDIQ